jgi:putative transposase
VEEQLRRLSVPLSGLEVNEARRLKQLEEENAKLKRLVADLTLDKMALKDALSKNW